MTPLPPGTQVDRFEVVRMLGEGGLARVFLVRHLTLGSLHALKLLTVSHSSLRQRFLTEGQVQARIRHPHVVAVTDVVHLRDEVGLVMEFVEGPTLEQLLAEGGSLSVAEVARLFQEICSGVAAAHAQGVLHRDLKPGNVLLAVHYDGGGGSVSAKVADFGIAKVAGELRRALGRIAPATAQGAMLGTPGYMAPEQQTDAAGVDARADVYSLGCILYELLTGAAPFRRRDVASSLQASLTGVFTPLLERVPDAPPGLVTAVERAIALEREARWGGVVELEREALRALATMTGRFPRPPAKPAPPPRVPRRPAKPTPAAAPPAAAPPAPAAPPKPATLPTAAAPAPATPPAPARPAAQPSVAQSQVVPPVAPTPVAATPLAPAPLAPAPSAGPSEASDAAEPPRSERGRGTPLGASPTCVPEFTNPRPVDPPVVVEWRPASSATRSAASRPAPAADTRPRAEASAAGMPALREPEQPHSPLVRSPRGGDLPPYRGRRPRSAGGPPAVPPEVADPPAPRGAAAGVADWMHATVGMPKGAAAPRTGPEGGLPPSCGAFPAPSPHPASTGLAPLAFRRRSPAWGAWLAVGALLGALIVAWFGAWVNTSASAMARTSLALREQAPSLEPLLGHGSDGLHEAWQELRASPEGEAAVSAYLASRTPTERITEGRRCHAALRERAAEEAREGKGEAARAAARTVLSEVEAADAALGRFEAALVEANDAWDSGAAPFALALGWVDAAEAPAVLQLPPLVEPSVAVADRAPSRRRR